MSAQKTVSVKAVDPRALWEQALREAKVRGGDFTTISGHKLKSLYGPDDVAVDSQRDLGYPGQFPFTRGVHATMYRGRLWTMRQFAGFGSAKQTNERFKFLLAHGQTGLSTAFDMPTLMGYDSDHARSLGEVGREGVSVATLEDMTRLFGDIPLDMQGKLLRVLAEGTYLPVGATSTRRADVRVVTGPPMIRDEDGVLVGSRPFGRCARAAPHRACS